MSQQPNLQFIKHELWKRGQLSFMLHKGQEEIYNNINSLDSSTKEICLRISRRYGKTYLGLILALETCLRTPNAQVLIAAPSSKQASNIITPLLREIIQEAPKGLIRQLKSSLRWECSNGSQLILGGFDTASESFRGLKANLVIVEEGGSTNPDNFLYITRNVLMPVLLSTNGRMIHIYTPAPTDQHPLHLIVEPKAIANNAFFTYDIHQCPLYNKRQISEMAEAVGGEHTHAWQTEFLCKISRESGKLAVPEFNIDSHTQQLEAPQYTNYWIAGDVGGIKDRSVFLLCCFDPYKNSTLILQEAHLPPNSTHKQIYDKIMLLSASKEIKQITLDAPGQTRAELAQNYNMLISFPKKQQNFFHPNLIQIREALTSKQLIIDKSCSLLIATLQGATFNNQRTDYERSEALGHADALAALIYAYQARLPDVRLPDTRNQDERMLALFAKLDAEALRQEEESVW